MAPPAPPVSIRRGPSRSGSAARGRRGAPPASTRIRPPWMMLGGIRPRRAGCGPHRRPRTPDSASALGSLADFAHPRPLLCPGQPPGDAVRLSTPHPLPLTRAPAHQPTPPPPPTCSTSPHHPCPPLHLSDGRRHHGELPQPPTVGRRADKRTPPYAVGVQALPPLPPAACIMAWRESYLPPYAPCVMAASGLCLSLLTLTERGGRRPLGGAPRTPGAATPDWRVVGPACARFEPPPPSFHWPRPPVPPRSPPCPPPRLGRRGPRVRFEPAPPLVALYGQCGPPGERRGPALPRAPPPTMAGARGLAAPGGLLCRGGRGDRALHTRPQLGSVPTAPGTDAGWGVPHRHPPQHHGHKGEVIAPGIGLPQAEGRCRPPGSSWPPTSCS